MTASPAKLREAADYIRKHGWVRGALFDDFGRACILGAWYAVHGLTIPWNSSCTAPLHKQIHDALGLPDIPEWNDAKERRKGHVIARLESAACKLETKEEL